MAEMISEILVLNPRSVMRREPGIVQLRRDEKELPLGCAALGGAYGLWGASTHTLLLRGFLVASLAAEKPRGGAESWYGVEGGRGATGDEVLRGGGGPGGRGRVTVGHGSDGILTLPLLVLLVKPRAAVCVAPLQPRPLVRGCGGGGGCGGCGRR